ncbi:MAG: DJ-1/PfpI family protein [Spirochaetales bacterium]|nr:DJ-1/PfpI family protein [Spirochaetales bacterium]
MKRVLVFLADGFEEVEAVTPVDFLRRGGIEVVIVGIGGGRITGGHGIEITADIKLSDLGPSEAGSADALVFPGGMPGASNLAAEERVNVLITDFNRQGKLIAAICASPAVILAPTGVLDGRRATCYPGMEKMFGDGTSFSSDRVVIDGNIITSRGPGTAIEFSAAIIGYFNGPEAKADVFAKSLQKE